MGVAGVNKENIVVYKCLLYRNNIHVSAIIPLIESALIVEKLLDLPPCIHILLIEIYL